MLNPLNILSIGTLAQPVISGTQYMYDGFSKVFSASGTPSADGKPITAEQLSEKISSKIDKILQKLGLNPNDSLKIEVDSSGDAWVVGSDPKKRGEIETAIADDRELSGYFAEWAVRYGPPRGSASFDWPRPLATKPSS